MATFDVFETLLVRAVSPHQAVFDVVGRRARAAGLVDCPADEFARCREDAERAALGFHGDAMTLDHIHAELARALDLPVERAAALVAMEMETEADLLRPVPSALDLLASTRRRAGRIVFVSDMYLPARFIEEQLRRHGVWEPGDALFVSHAHGETKRSGRLFDVVAHAEDAAVHSIRHHGNDDVTDVRGAHRAGARAVSLPAGNSNRFERLLGADRFTTDGLAPAMAGASRLARLGSTPSSDHERALVDVAAGVIGPVLTAYVSWILDRAHALDLRRLYFVSRDGEVLLHLAQRLGGSLGSQVELRYLHASRLTWNRSVACPELAPQVWESLMVKSTTGVTNRDILHRLGLDDEIVRPFTADGDGDGWDSAVDRSVLTTTLDRLRDDGTLRATRAEHDRLLSIHLRQQGLFDDVAHGFVDVGWRGSQHDVLLDLQVRNRVALAHGLFLGLEASPSPWGLMREAYLHDTRDPTRARAHETLPVPFNFVEMFCSADHGSLVGYRTTDHGVVPVLDEGNPALRPWGLPLVRDVVGAYASELDVAAAQVCDRALHSDVKPALRTLLSALWESPTDAEAQAWGSFPWEVGMGRRSFTVPFAPPLSFGEVARRARARPSSMRHPDRLIAAARVTEWPQASWARSRWPMRIVGFRRLTLRAWRTGTVRLLEGVVQRTRRAVRRGS